MFLKKEGLNAYGAPGIVIHYLKEDILTPLAHCNRLPSPCDHFELTRYFGQSVGLVVSVRPFRASWTRQVRLCVTY